MMIQNLIENNGSDLSEVFSAIDSSLTQVNLTDNISELISYLLNISLKCPDAKSASIFFLNEDNFEFEHRATIPCDYKDHSIVLFDFFIEKGVIGTVLDSENPYIYKKDFDDLHSEISTVIIPLIVSWGVLGVLIIVIDNPNFNVSKDELLNIKIPISLFSIKFENVILINRLKKNVTLLEQQIAVRQIDLSRSNRELQLILNSVQTGILVIDVKTKKIVNTNPEALRILGIDNSNIIGQDVSVFYSAFEYYEDVFDDKIKFSRNFETAYEKANGDIIPLLRTFSNITIGDNHYRIESFSDISDQKKAADELKKTNELLELKIQERTEDLKLLVIRLKAEIEERKRAEKVLSQLLSREKELSKMKSDFVSMISHEFRTPLTLIRSAAQMIQKFSSTLNDEDKDSYLQRIIKSVDSMTELIENVLFIGKSDAKKVNYSPKEINVIKVLNIVIEDVLFANNNSRIINFEHECLNPLVCFDEHLIRQIFYNLLTNALKYSPVDKPIDFLVNSYDDKFVFKVRDYGIGIPEEEQFSIFDIFHRAKNVGDISGTGIGLSVVLRSLELLKGNIDVSSKENYGTTFTVTIPVASQE